MRIQVEKHMAAEGLWVQKKQQLARAHPGPPTPPFLAQPRGLEILSFPTKLISPIKGNQLLGRPVESADILTIFHWPADPP